MKRTGILLVAALALLVCAMVLKGLLVTLPEPPAPSAGEFDSRRAVARLAFVLGDQRPHPVDSDANDAVRARLIQQMRALGLEPQVSDDVACNSSKSVPSISCARVRNVFATIGPPQGRHLMLVSHYDSSPAGPGAADDGIGMAVMLETAAQLRGRKLARPISFLFTDGEEAGLLGAGAFLETNPLADRVETLLNFEARGVSGPAIMFETSTPDGAAVALYKTSVDRPAANSLTADFAKLIPNSTDVELFKARRDWTILNFAMIGNETRYHSRGDNLAALDLGSVQHMGDQALALATFIAAGREVWAGGEHGYADLLGRGMVMMPLWAGLVTLAVLGLLFVFFGWRSRGGLGRAVLAVTASIVGAAGLAWLGQNAVSLVRAGEYWRGYPEVTGLAVYLSALVGGLLSLGLIARNSEPSRLRVAFWLIFLILGGALCAVAPRGTIFFLLPPLVLGVGMLLEPRWGGAERVAALLAFLLLFLSWAPLLHLSETLLDFDAAWVFAAAAAIILLPALIELKALAAEMPRPLLLTGAVGLVFAGWAAAALAPAYSADRKQAFGIEYVWDRATGQSSWMVANDGAPLPAAFAGFKKNVTVPFSGRRRWAAPAPRQQVIAPAVEKLAERQVPGGRLLTLRLRSNGAETVTLRAKAEAAFRAVRVGGGTKPFGTGDGKGDYFLRCHGRSCEGLRLDLLVGSRDPVEVTVIGTRAGLPAAADKLVAARPATAQPQYSPDAIIALDRVKL
ncbi:MAG TPA: M20/M25/M40 family metallo-hydrolase [Allosphingosinicella sp.]|jgi:hypothetical protein